MISLAATSAGPAAAKEIGEYSSYQDAPKKAVAPEAEIFQSSPAVPLPEASSDTKAAELKLPEAYAEPISPATVALFHHLKAFQGHLLIGGGGLQAVLAGVPAKEVAAGWQPVILAVFEKQDGVFHRSEAVATLDLRPTAGDTVLYPIGVDLGTEKGAKLAFITQVYGSADPKGSRQTMTWRFDAESGTLAAATSEFATAGAKAAKNAGKWPLRLTGSRAETLPGKGYWLRGADADVLAFLPYRHVIAKATDGGLEFEAAGGENSPLEGFELLLGRDATGKTLARAASLDDCLFGTQRPRKALKEEAKLPWIQACQANVMKSTLRLTSRSDEASPAVRPVYVFSGNGTPLLYTALSGSKDSTDLVLPVGNDATYQLADTRAGRIIPGTSVIAPVEAQTKTVEVQGSPSGLLRVLPGASKTAAVLSLRRLDRENGSSAGIIAAGDGDSQLRLAADRLLIRSWPADLELETGGYELTVSRGGEGKICVTRALVQKQRRVVVDCNKGAAPFVKGAGERTYVDLAAAEDRDLPLASFRQALGVDLLAEPVEEAGGRAAPLKVLRTEDEATGTGLAFVPATSALAGRWERQKQNLTHDDAAARFMRLVRGEGGQGMVELGCPGPGMSAFEYELLVQRIQPDAVRLFGCEGAGRQSEWLAVYDRLSAGRRVPYLLTAESGLKTAPGEAPRLLLRMPSKSAREKPDAAIKALLQAEYEISAGGGVTLTKVTRTPKTGMVAEVAYEALLATPTVLALYGEKGLIKEEKIPPQAAAQGTLSVALQKAETGWLRAELRGDTGILATTTAVPVSRLLPKEGESH